MLADKIDAECQRIVTECYDEVVTMLKRDESCFRTIIDVLMEKETILGPEFVELRNKTLCAVPRRHRRTRLRVLLPPVALTRSPSRPTRLVKVPRVLTPPDLPGRSWAEALASAL
jgi:hypothetical protein